MREITTTRIRNAGTTLPVNCSYQRSPGGTTYDTVTQTALLRTTEDNVTPNFRKRQRAGEIIINDYRSVLVDVDDGVCNSSESYSGGSTSWSGTIAMSDWSSIVKSAPEPTCKSVDSLVDLAVTEAHANITNVEAQLLVSIAEAKKTQKLITETFRGIKQLLIDADDVQIDYAKGFLRKEEAAQRWLAVRYGFRPLVNDLNQIVAAFTKVGEAKYTTVLGFSDSEGTSYEHDAGYAGGGDPSKYKVKMESWHNTKRSVRAGVIMKYYMDNVNAIQSFGLGDIVSTAWELVPYSFLVDRFFNTANYFASVSPLFTANVVGSFATVREINHTGYKHTGTDVYQVYSHDTGASHNGEYNKIVTTTTRYAHPDLPLLPSVDIRLTPAIGLDILALLTRFRSPKSRKRFKAMDSLRI